MPPLSYVYTYGSLINSILFDIWVLLCSNLIILGRVSHGYLFIYKKKLCVLSFTWSDGMNIPFKKNGICLLGLRYWRGLRTAATSLTGADSDFVGAVSSLANDPLCLSQKTLLRFQIERRRRPSCPRVHFFSINHCYAEIIEWFSLSTVNLSWSKTLKI